MTSNHPHGTSSSPDSEPTCSTAHPRARRLQKRYIWFLAAWALVFVSSTYLLTGDVVVQTQLRWLVAFVPSIVALAAVLAYWRYLREADELARLIELHALALAVSAGFVVWPAIELLGRSGVPVHAGPNLLVLVMVGAYALGSVLGRRRYQ